MSPSGEALNPEMPLLLCFEQVSIDEKLRSTYISTYKLERIPNKKQFVLYDMLTGKEVDRLDWHNTSLAYYRTLLMIGHCFSPDGRHFTYKQEGPMLPIYKVTFIHKEE
jgi:hypothetical protein